MTDDTESDGYRTAYHSATGEPKPARRCTWCCPHGDQCTLAYDHDGGHNHRGCTCNAPDTDRRCETECSHGSRCMLVATHDGGHETEHGCICYDLAPAPRTVELDIPDAKERARRWVEQQATQDEIATLRAECTRLANERDDALREHDKARRAWANLLQERVKWEDESDAMHAEIAAFRANLEAADNRLADSTDWYQEKFDMRLRLEAAERERDAFKDLCRKYGDNGSDLLRQRDEARALLRDVQAGPARSGFKTMAEWKVVMDDRIAKVLGE